MHMYLTALAAVVIGCAGGSTADVGPTKLPPAAGMLELVHQPVNYQWVEGDRQGTVAVYLVGDLRLPREDQQALSELRMGALCHSAFEVTWQGTDPAAGGQGAFWYYKFRCTGPPQKEKR